MMRRPKRCAGERGRRPPPALVSLGLAAALAALAALPVSAQRPPSQPVRPPASSGPVQPVRPEIVLPPGGLEVRDEQYPDAKIVPAAGFFSPGRPKVIVLVHGATEGPQANPIIGHLIFPRVCYGFKFVRALLGSQSGDLYTFPDDQQRSTTLTEQNWPEGAYRFPFAQRLPTAAVQDGVVGHHFVSTSPTRRDLSVMLTHRDGSRSTAEQATVAANQIFQLYNAAFGSGEEPQIILVAYSMGGIVSRYILSRPGGMPSRESFRCEFIRNRTLFLVTLASPHEGSPLADTAQAIANVCNGTPPYIETVIRTTGASRVREVLASQTSVDDPAVLDLRMPAMRTMNLGPLSPERARRADRTLIPIYALSGRDPSSRHLNSPVLGGFNLPSDLRTVYDVSACVILDQALKACRSQGWGAPPPGSANLDWVQRVSLQQLVQAKAAEATGGMNPCVKLIVQRLGGIYKVSGLASFDPSFPVYLDKYWEPAIVTREVPFKHWECGQFRVPWEDCKSLDVSALVQFLVNLQYNIQQLAQCLNPANWKLKETISVPAVGLRVSATKPSDGEMDSDGLVQMDSGLGLRLGRSEIEYFDHKQRWPVGMASPTEIAYAYGSWYRYYDGPWSGDNHATTVTNREVARWVHDTLVRNAGPVPGPGPLSSYVLPPQQSAPLLRSGPIPRP